MNSPAPRAVLLATATIAPGDMPNTARRDPAIRMRDYRRALHLWLKTSDLPIVFCENSGADLAPLASLAARFPGRLEFLSFRAPAFPLFKGKGYGEILIFEHALAQSQWLSPDTRILKISGRLFLANFNAIWPRIRHDDADVCATWHHRDLAFGDSRFFLASPAFITDAFITCKEELDEREGREVYVEHLLARGMLKAALRGDKVRTFPQPLDIRGISGTANDPLGRPARIKARMVHLARRAGRMLGLGKLRPRR